jgi:hypothetical protein
VEQNLWKSKLMVKGRVWALIVCSLFAALLGQAGVAAERRSIKETCSSSTALRVFIASLILVGGEARGECLIQRQQTAWEQYMTMISCCKSLALHKNKRKA